MRMAKIDYSKLSFNQKLELMKIETINELKCNAISYLIIGLAPLSFLLLAILLT